MKPFLSHDNDPPPPPPQPPPPPPPQPQPPSTPPSTTDNLATSATASKPAKRPTRQWAAWTREEEECFFTALRQVGKNFEKITCRVQSKNKDQVRHYYYRLVRRMNKLLAPGLSLDAKNSKDTNAAMLRWWSLLEKYSCKASKLHLKPRRFKIFVEALEHQLMKDRKKNGKKRASLGESFLPPPPTTASNFNKLSGSDSRALKVSVTDNQNGQKSGQGRGSSRRNTSMGVIRSSNKGESSHTKQARQQRKTGTISAAAIRRWEKAAMAGVSLVADAAEHLERTAVELYSANQEQSDPGPSVQVQMNTSNLSKLVGVIEDNAQTTTKLKLQLFPVDESTRKTLEMDKHNPHLELTLSTRKKISSVLEHLDRKWGSSRVACGELIIFPFNIQRENLLGYQRWTRDSVVTAGEVYAMIGSPTVFRLRYGWIPSAELQSGSSGTISSSFNVLENGSKQSLPPAEEMDKLDNLVDHVLGNHQTYNGQNSSFKEPTAPTFGEANKNTDVDLDRDALGHHLGLNVLSIATEDCVASPKNLRNMVDQKVRKIPSLSTREWTDTLTNVGAGELVTQVSDAMDANCADTPAFRSSQCLEDIPFSCDSFDAAIAAHISGHNKIGFSGPSAHSSSIWDAEETCDAFLFQNRSVPNNRATAPGVGLSTRSSARTGIMAQNSVEDGIAADNLPEDPMNECPSETHETSYAKNLSSLTDIYWPDSLGPLELDVPSCKYYSEDLILSDSMSGLNRLLASSLDAFQNCTFFGFDEKGPLPSASGGQGGASFVGKIGISDNAAAQSLQA